MLLDSPIIPNYSRKLPRLGVASLASRWYLHFLFVSGGFGAFTISSRLVLDVFFYRLRQLSIAKYSYAESIPPFLLLNVAQGSSPDLDLTGKEARAIKCCPLFPHYARCSRMPIIPHIMPAYCARPYLWLDQESTSNTVSSWLSPLWPFRGVSQYTAILSLWERKWISRFTWNNNQFMRPNIDP